MSYETPDIDTSKLTGMIQENKIKRGSIASQGSFKIDKSKKDEFEGLLTKKDDKKSLDFSRDLSKIKENNSDSDEERKFIKDNWNKGGKHNRTGSNARNASNKQEEEDRDKVLNKRAYEYYKSNAPKKEDIFLGQKDRNNKLKDKQSVIAKKVDEMQSKLRNINDEIKNKAVMDNYSLNHQDAYVSMVKENNQLRKELTAVQLAKSVVSSKNKDKKLVKTIGNDAQATRDRKKVTDLLKLVDMLKKQLQESEERMKSYQQINKSAIGHGGLSQTTHLDKNNAVAIGQKEQNARMQGIQAKNDELMNNLTQLRNQVKSCKQENAQLVLDLKQANEKMINLSKENRTMQLAVNSADEYQKQIIDLKKQRDNTELRLKELLSSPFFRDHGEKAAKYARIHELEEESVQLNSVNEQLAKNVDSQKKDIIQLKDELNELKQYTEDLKEENESLRIDLTTQASKFGPLQQLQQLDHPTYLKTLGALTMNSFKSKLKNHKDLQKELRDVHDPDEEEEYDEEETKDEQIKTLNQEIEQLKVEKGELAIHLEKVQAMLRIQIETAQQREKIYSVEKEAFELKYKALLDKAQELAEITDMKGFLQADQQKHVDISNVPLHRKGNVDYTDNVSEFSDDEDTQIDESKGQNFFDLWVGSCQVYPQNLSKATQGRVSEDDNILLFATFDFYDHETQSTPVCEGQSCYFNFQCSYKVNTKGAFLHYLETGSLRVELYTAYRQDAVLLGTADVSLDFLFSNNKRERVSAVLNQNISLTLHGIAVGEVTLKARLRKPISNQIRFYIESKNNELEKLEELEYKQKQAQSSSLPVEEIDHQDDSLKRVLVIAIEKGQGFEQRASTFVYYSIQGKDYYTKSVQGSQPNYDHHQKIEITNVAQFLNQIQKIPVSFYIFDDLQPYTNDKEANNDCLGTATIKLDGLNKNQIIDAVLTVYDEKKDKRGTLYAKIFWYDYQDSVQSTSNLGNNMIAKQWEKEFVLKLAKALKARHLNTSNGFMIFDRNNDQVIDQSEFVSSCLGTLNMTDFNRDEVIYFYEKQRQPFNRDVFETLLRPYLLEDKQRLQYLEEINLLQKHNNKKQDEEQQQAQYFNLEQMQNNQYQKSNISNMESPSKSLKVVNELLMKNTETIMDQSRLEAIRDMIAETVIHEMRTRSAIDVFQEIDNDQNDELDVNELHAWIVKYGVRASPDEIRKFLKTLDKNQNNTIDLLEFMKYIQKESNADRILFYTKYPKLERVAPQDRLGNYDESKVFTDDQIIHDIEEQIFAYMMEKQVKILDLHQQMDKDRNFSIGRQEFGNFFKNKIGTTLTKRDMDVIFKTFDKDGDGQISVKEFVEHLKKAINNRKSLSKLRTSQNQSPSKIASNMQSRVALDDDQNDDKFIKTTKSGYQKTLQFKQ